MQNIKLITDPSILEIEIKENDDPLIDWRDQKDILFGPSPEIKNNTDYTKLRLTVFNKLKEAQSKLPNGIKFCIYEGYRSLQLQEQLFNERYNIIKNKYPDWNHEQIFLETTKMVSPIINLDGSVNTPPHSTGGAVDLYLVDENGEAVDMGIHPKDWMQDTDGILSLTASTIISDQARFYRKIMSEVLGNVGFVNYPTEFWHWSYGDRYWAYFAGSKHALYGSI
jgi:D-alanyl-D-alanine dipeptidase